MSDDTLESLRAERDAALAKLAHAEELLVISGERAAAAGVVHDPFWIKLVGDVPYKPADPSIPLRHMHPLHAKPVFEAARGTAAADVMVGLCFRNMIDWNRSQRLLKAVDLLRAQRDAALADLGRPPGSFMGEDE